MTEAAKNQLNAMVTLLTQGEYDARYETPNDNQLVLIIVYDGNEILRHASESGIVLTDEVVRMFGNSALKRMVSLGLEKQRELSQS